MDRGYFEELLEWLRAKASGWSGEICSSVTHASCSPSCRVVKTQQCVRSFLLLGRDSGSQSTALIIEYVFLAGRQTQKRLLPP